MFLRRIFLFCSDESEVMKVENITLYEQVADLKAELIILQEHSVEHDSLYVENTDLKSIIENQHEKINEYDEEVNKTKEHMLRLESLIQKIQEDKLSSSVSMLLFKFSGEFHVV